jgi:hypothetical protein
MPDELMIDWGTLPPGSTASIYLPGVSAYEVLEMASRMYTSHSLSAFDQHTLECPASGITYIPIPVGTGVDFAGILSVDLPPRIRKGQIFSVVVRQVTDAFGKRTGRSPVPEKRGRKAAASVRPDIRWRRTLGAFELAIPIRTKDVLLEPEERLLSVLRWISTAIPTQSRWFPVFERYLDYVGVRVSGFGGDPSRVPASPFGDVATKPTLPEPGGPDHRVAYTGKVSCLVFDRFGDFEGFVLDTEEGEIRFSSREQDVELLIERAWNERLRLTVFSGRDEPHRPALIIIREPPATFHER